MKKRLLLFLFAMLTTVSTWAMDFEVDGLRYWSDYDGNETTVYVTSSYGEGCSGDVVIPSSVTYGGTTYSVTSIGDWAFSSCSGLTSVVIPSSVTEIGDGAFYGCSGLTSVVIPSSVTKIDVRVFSGCSGLKSIVVNAENKVYDSRDNCNAIIERMTNTLVVGCANTTIPSSVTSIGESAFDGCSGLTSVVIPSSVTSIGSFAFDDCVSLTSVVIPSSVTEIGDWAFYGCSGLTSVTIPSSVTSIGESAFDGCSGLTSVEIPSSVTEIGSYAFSGCNSLTSVTIPSTVTVIGYNAFPSPYDRYGDPNEECKLNTITLLTKTNQPALGILGDYTSSDFYSKGYVAVYVADGLLPFYEWFWGGFYNFIEIGDVPNVINGEGGIASIVKVYNNKVDINVDLEEGYSVSEIKVNGNVVYPASSGNKALSADVSVIKNSETSFTLVGVTADDTIEVAYNKSTPTSVGVIEMQREVKGIYDIYGRNLSAPQRGINIINGKKVIVK